MTELEYPLCPECRKTLIEYVAPERKVFLCCAICGRIYTGEIVIKKYEGRYRPSYLG